MSQPEITTGKVQSSVPLQMVPTQLRSCRDPAGQAPREGRDSPLVLTVAMHLVVRTSQMRMVLSPDAVTNRSGLLGCQQS